MKTEILPISQENIKRTAKALKEGNIVAFPTETVYGLGACIYNDNAIKKIFKAKGRPQNNPLIVHIAKKQWLNKLISTENEIVNILTDKFWPGPLTIIVPKSGSVSNIVTASLENVAIRYPSNKVAQELIRQLDAPICAPSANISGTPSPTKAEDVYNDLNGKIPIILDGGRCEIGLESTVIKVNKNSVTLLRPGHITAEELEKHVKVEVDRAVYEKLDKNKKILSPGLSFKHYAPKAEIELVEADTESFIKYVNEKSRQNDCIVVLNRDDATKLNNRRVFDLGINEIEQEYNLFYILRKLDKENIKKAYIQSPKKEGIGLALYNRLIRASQYKIKRIDNEVKIW